MTVNYSVKARFALYAPSSASRESLISPERFLIVKIASSRLSPVGIAQKTVFAGFVNNPEDFYKRIDVAVFPSMWQEPFGLVGIEAMAYARPVVAFDVGGVRQWLKDGKNGIIVPERNTTLFASALDKLAQNPSLVKSLGENGRDFVRTNFTRENFLKTFLQLQ